MANSAPNIRDSLGSQLLPKFQDRNLEASYREHNIETKRRWMQLGGIVAAGLTAASEPQAKLLLPDDLIALDHAARWYFQIPAFLVGSVIALRSKSARLIEQSVLSIVVLTFLSTLVLLGIGGSDGREFYTVAIIQYLVFGFFVFGFRFRPIFLGLAPSYLLFHATVFYLVVTNNYVVTNDYKAMEGSFGEHFISTVFFAGIAFAAYSVDISARSAFLSNLALSMEYDERLTLQHERTRWLQIITDFLRHELKNSLIGVRSSLELIERRNDNNDLQPYILRAEKSTGFMKRLLDEASSATNLESALASIQIEKIDISELIEFKLIEYREQYPECAFELQKESVIYTDCDVDRMVQVLDKLINNAVEHGNPDHPVVIDLCKNNQSTIITVTNFGEPLAIDDEDIFEPFVSHKGKSAEGGFGFGLYVVKRVIEAHGGTVTAKSLTNPEGAAFTLTLPS